MTDDTIELKDVIAAVGEVKNAASERFKLIDTTTQAVKETQTELKARLLDVEQKQARRGGPAHPGAGSVGDELLREALQKSAALTSMREGHRGRASFDLPPDFLQRKNTILSPGASLPEQLPGIVPREVRRLTIRDLIPATPTTAGAVNYLQETGFAIAAAVVPEGSVKPESSITFEAKTAQIVTIAHWLKASVQVLADTPTLVDFVARRLQYGLAFIEELQLLRGSGVDNNLLGLLPAAIAFNLPIDPSSGIKTRIDVLRLAITQLQDNSFTPNGIVLHPIDWALIELAKDAESRYLAGQPRGATMASLWGVPVIPTPSMTQGQFLIGDFQQAAMLFDRQQSLVEISTEDSDNFRRNLVTIRAEERIGLAVVRPEAMVTGLFPAFPTPLT